VGGRVDAATEGLAAGFVEEGRGGERGEAAGRASERGRLMQFGLLRVQVQPQRALPNAALAVVTGQPIVQALAIEHSFVHVAVVFRRKRLPRLN
jgi:hypothetical protein